MTFRVNHKEKALGFPSALTCKRGVLSSSPSALRGLKLLYWLMKRFLFTFRKVLVNGFLPTWVFVFHVFHILETFLSVKTGWHLVAIRNKFVTFFVTSDSVNKPNGNFVGRLRGVRNMVSRRSYLDESVISEGTHRQAFTTRKLLFPPY
jgi:hypothetical protein